MTNVPTTGPSTTSGSTSPPASASGTSDAAKAEAGNVAEQGKQSAGQVAGEARSQAADLARTARDEARSRADGEVGKLAGFLNELGDELNGMADGSPPQDGHLEGLARDGAQAANRLAQRLDSGGLDGALHDVSMFARRRPGVFLAAAFGVGIAIGRVTRNADMPAISEEMQHGNGSGSDGSAHYQPESSPAMRLSSSPTAGSMTTEYGSTPTTSGQRS